MNVAGVRFIIDERYTGIYINPVLIIYINFILLLLKV